ncbi:MAG: histidinol phosphatase [Candidatus Hydrogenedentes bacterium]|nr:histidinol phosphatase [Candidatus Hydrogenedentota bacterium]
MRIRSLFTCAVCTTVLAVAGTGLTAWAGEPGTSPGRKYTSTERMAESRLEAAHKDVQGLKEQRQAVKLETSLHDFRSILHAHADDSDHTGGTLPEMLADAKKAGVQVIMLSDHFRPPRDFIDGRWRGMRDGVLFIPGSETKGFLVYPEQSVMDKMDAPKPELIAAVTEGDGLIFLSHVEERTDHPMDGLTGMEIYNRHYDAMDDMDLFLLMAAAITDPVMYADTQELLRLYPDEVLAAQLDYPQVYIDKWDAEMQKQRVVGIAADDCHHNNVLVAKMVDEETVLLGTNVDDDDDMRTVTAADRPGIKEMTKGHQPGDIIAKLDLDPYYIFFHNVSTHILAPELTEPAIRTALLAGHAYVSHDWMCDPTGFVYGARKGAEAKLKPDFLMGDEVPMADDLWLVAEFPLACDFKIIKNGQIVKEGNGRSFEFKPDGPGAYRVEGWLTVDDEQRVWIYTNPIYVR